MASKLFLVFAVVTILLLARLHFGSIFNRAVTNRMTDADLELQLPRLQFQAPGSTHRSYYESDVAREFCLAHGYTVYQPDGEGSLASRVEAPPRKIYDLFMVNTELDWLEIRLNTTYDYVDYFVVVESATTFQGSPKPLAVKDNWKRFEPYKDKIIHHLLEIPAGFHPKSAWDLENLQRNAMFDQVFPKLDGPQAPTPGDAIIVADVDEIPRPSTLLLLRTCNFPMRLTLASKFYYYSFQFLHTGREWSHPQATVYRGMKSTIRPADLRNSDGGAWLQRIMESGRLGNAAWHCSSCFATVDEFLNKMASFSHVWMNKNGYRDPARIASAVRTGRDLWGRWSDKFVRLEGNSDVPPLVQAEEERFRYMLNRDGENAGFIDYP